MVLSLSLLFTVENVGGKLWRVIIVYNSGTFCYRDSSFTFSGGYLQFKVYPSNGSWFVITSLLAMNLTTPEKRGCLNAWLMPDKVVIYRYGCCPNVSMHIPPSKSALHTSQIYKYSSTTLWWNLATEWNTYARKKQHPAPCHSLLSSPFGISSVTPFCWLPSPLVGRKIQWLTCASFLPKQLWLASVVTATGQFHLLRHVRRETLTDGNWWQLAKWKMCRLPS